MAMTKAERAEFEALLHEAALSRALRFSCLPTPQRMAVPEEGYVNGYDSNSYLGDVQKMWSSGASHGNGHRSGPTYRGAALQKGRALFQTKLAALIDLRLKKEREFARALAEIDKDIDTERSAGQPGDDGGFYTERSEPSVLRIAPFTS